MDVIDAIRTRLDLREYADESVSDEIKRDVLEAARLASSGRNLQHWRFILVDDDERLAELGERSPTGGWVAGADFAVAVTTDPELNFNELDAGKALTHMQLAAWDHGVGSRMYTTTAEEVYEFLEVPADQDLTAVVGFGYPTREIRGQKDRKPLSEVAFDETFGTPTRFGE
ncbi:MAG: nitroreductase family protein [Halobacteriota archaeon]